MNYIMNLTTRISLVGRTHSRLKGDFEFKSHIDIFKKKLYNESILMSFVQG